MTIRTLEGLQSVITVGCCTQRASAEHRCTTDVLVIGQTSLHATKACVGLQLVRPQLVAHLFRFLYCVTCQSVTPPCLSYALYAKVQVSQHDHLPKAYHTVYHAVAACFVCTRISTA